MQFDTKVLLQPEQLKMLRDKNEISKEEYAYVAGDLVVAENVQTEEKRVLGYRTQILGEGTKRILKG